MTEAFHKGILLPAQAAPAGAGLPSRMLRAERRMVPQFAVLLKLPLKAVSKAASCKPQEVWVDSCTRKANGSTSRAAQTQSRAPCTIESCPEESTTRHRLSGQLNTSALLQLVQMNYSGMPDQAWEKGFLMPELPAGNPGSVACIARLSSGKEPWPSARRERWC